MKYALKYILADRSRYELFFIVNNDLLLKQNFITLSIQYNDLLKYGAHSKPIKKLSGFPS